MKKVGVVLVCLVLGLPMLPYLLWRVWANRIPFKKQGRGLDFDLVKPKVGE